GNTDWARIRTRGPAPTCCVEAGRYRCIRNSCPCHRHAGKGGSWDRRSVPAPVPLPRRLRLPKSPKPECASESPSGLAAAIGLHFRPGVEIGIRSAACIAPGGGCLTLRQRRKTAIAGTGAEIAALDAVGKLA